MHKNMGHVHLIVIILKLVTETTSCACLHQEAMGIKAIERAGQPKCHIQQLLGALWVFLVGLPALHLLLGLPALHFSSDLLSEIKFIFDFEWRNISDRVCTLYGLKTLVWEAVK